MGKGSSSSESAQTTATTTTDARVGADNGAVVIQAGGQQNISFSPEVAQAAGQIVNSLMNFSNGVVSAARDTLNQSLVSNQAASQNAINAAVSVVNQEAQSLQAIQQSQIAAGERQTASVLDFGKSALAASPSTTPAASSAITNQQTAATPNYTLIILGGVALLGVVFVLSKGK